VIMRIMIILLVGLAGCTSSRPTARVSSVLQARATLTNADSATVPQFTRYELGEYRYPAGSAKNESSILRATRVPAGAVSNPNSEKISETFDPLPPSAELAAEIHAQHDITERIRAIQSAIVETETKAKAQYAVLVSDTNEVAKLRQQLVFERARLHDAEIQERTGTTLPTQQQKISNAIPASTSTEDIKW